jgi:hypothetical protein
MIISDSNRASIEINPMRGRLFQSHRSKSIENWPLRSPQYLGTKPNHEVTAVFHDAQLAAAIRGIP